jgi:prolyl-tRNA synthetase
LLDEIQSNIYNKALKHRDSTKHFVNTFEEFEKAIEQGGFVYAHWDGTIETENKIKELTKATIRCVPIDNPLENGTCILTGKPSTQRVLFAKAY